MKGVIRSYCVYVLLGRPRRPFRRMAGLAAEAPTFWFSSAPSPLAFFLGIHRLPLPPDQNRLLWELDAIKNRHEGKMLTLIALTPEMRDFVKKNSTALSEHYIIKEVL